MRNLRFKRITAVCLILLLVASLLCTTGCSIVKDLLGGGSEKIEMSDKDREKLIEQIGGVSETYKGTVSEYSYSSAQEAAQAFVSEEILGGYEAVGEATSLGTLSDAEVAELGIPAEYTEGMQSVEKLEVAYASGSSSDAAFVTPGVSKIDTLNKDEKITVYVIKYESEWKYFAPCPQVGEPLSRDYYESVFDSARYENCTLETTMTVKVEVGGMVSSLLGTNVEMTMTQLIKHADGKVYLEQIIEMDQMGEESREVIYAYMEEVDGVIQCYVKTDEDSTEWYETNLSTIGFSSLEELTPFYNDYLDHTYFSKTSTGFELSEESARFYMRQALSDMTELNGLVDIDEMDINMYAEYLVQEGALSAMDMNAHLSMEIEESGVKVDLVEIIKSRTTCTDYGTTVVTKPFTE